MPNLLPFRARYSLADSLYIPGEEPPKTLDATRLSGIQPPALFLYCQQFGKSVRYGVTGLINGDEAAIFPHEETLPERVSACAESIAAARTDLGSLWFWCHDEAKTLAPLLQPANSPSHEATDRLGVSHRYWPITNPAAITRIQAVVAGRDLFLADGHHRFVAGWKLTTIQIRNETLRSRPAHRLILDAGELRLPYLYPISNVETFWQATPPGSARFGVLVNGQPLRGIEIPCATGENKLNALRRQVIRDARVEALRDIEQAAEGQTVLLVETPDIDAIERDARRGVLLPPRSTDFYPKLAAGLVIQA